MTSLSVRLQHYIAARRSLGFDLSSHERVLRRFAEFADGEGTDHITVDLFLRWKKHYGSADNNTWATRLSMVRVFASWLQGSDPRTEVPPHGLIRGKPRRARPFIYTDGQIVSIVTEAARLPSSCLRCKEWSIKRFDWRIKRREVMSWIRTPAIRSALAADRSVPPVMPSSRPATRSPRSLGCAPP